MPNDRRDHRSEALSKSFDFDKLRRAALRLTPRSGAWLRGRIAAYDDCNGYAVG